MSRDFLMPGYIVTGENALDNLSAKINELGTKPLLVTDPVISKLDCFKSVTELLEKQSVSYAVFSNITGEPTDTMVNEAVKTFTDGKCDFIIAVGGGSSLDIMKAVAVIVKCGGNISDYLGKQITDKLLPMVAVPTTAGTGSEATRFTVITDTKTGVKMLLGGPSLIPDVAIIDPQFTLSSPKGITAATGLDALTHAVESYTSRKAQPLTDTMALSAIRRIFRFLPAAYNDGSNIKARTEMAIAAFEAGVAINNASVTIVHGMSRPIGANFHVPHGISNAMLLEKCLGFAIDGAYDRFADIARTINCAGENDDDKTASEKLIVAIKKLCDICEIPTLEGYGIEKDKFLKLIDRMSDDAIASGSPANTIKEITKENVMSIYNELFS